MIENTGNRDPLLHLIGAMDDGNSKYITDMEAAGQAQLVASEQLPTKMGDQSEYEALGFTFGEVDKRDPMFRPATLPAGWKRKPSEHSMWSHIFDELGRERVAIFYKAAFYDRSAHMSLTTVHGYVNSARYNGDKPVLDDKWCTPAAVAEACEGIVRRANESIELWDGRDDDYARGRVAEANTEIEWARALIAEVSA